MTKLYPLMPLRDIVIFPHMVAPLVVGRKKSIQALEDAMDKKTDILLVTQIKSSVDDPAEDELYTYGTLAAVMQLLRLPDGTIKALVEGKTRAKILSYVPNDKFLQAEVEERTDNTEPTNELLAYERELRTFFEQYATGNKKIAKEIVNSVKAMDNPLKMLNVICAHLPLKSEEKQQILELEPLTDRIAKVLEVLDREIELAELEMKINAKVKMRMGKTQRDYYLGEKVREIQTEIGQNENGLDEMGELEETIKNKHMPALAKDKALKEFKKLRSMPPMSAETTVVRNYIDCIVNLPWEKKDTSKSAEEGSPRKSIDILSISSNRNSGLRTPALARF